MAAAQRIAGRVLVIDDEESILSTFRLCLEDAGYSVDTATSASEGLRLAARQPFDVCLLDLSIGEDSGLETLPRLKQLAPWLRVLMVTAHSAVEQAMDVLRAGADDYLVKPCLPEQLRIAIARQVEARKLTARVEQLEREAPKTTPDLESQSPMMAHVIETARHVAATDANILLLGESGTGKGELAKAIHRWSARNEAEFVTINCPSLSAELLESELFGHNKGSFTGATANTVGRVTQADGGTLFLDEIGDFPLVLQPKLLRFIQDKEFERIGDPVTRRADVRIVAATNRDLDGMVKGGAFRQDLLYRLNVITIELPALRDRPEDLPHLAAHFLARFAANYNRPARGFAPEAMAMIQNYTWPGNVRELMNVTERATILCQGDKIESKHLAIGGGANVEARARVGTPISLEDLERLHIQQVLAMSETLDAAAKTLGIDASTLYRKRKSYALGV